MTKRALLIAEAANPEWASVPLIGWSMTRALSKILPTHLVTHVRNRDALIRAGLIEGHDFTAIDSDAVAAPLYRLASLLRGKRGLGWTTNTAFSALSYYYFEWLVWRRFGQAIVSHEFRIVHRITPVSPTIPSLLATRCQRAGVPFVLGPLNGGVPWPAWFDAARRKEREWLSYVRSAYRLMPGYRSTLNSAAAILTGSRDTLRQIPSAHRPKCIYLPENAVDPLRFSLSAAPSSGPGLRACFVGRLVPYKGPDMLLEAVAPLLKSGRLRLDIIGDGPMMADLKSFIDIHQLGTQVTLHGWVEHGKVQNVMYQSQLLLFPSIREFGGGVVLEAMALGLVPVVVDYAGPGELVTAETGFKVPIGQRDAIITGLRAQVTALCDNPEPLAAMSQQARGRVSTLFTWDAKAVQISAIYDWVQGQRTDKPDFFGP